LSIFAQRIGWSRTDIYWDLDGSLTGTGKPNQYVSAYKEYNAWPDCTVSKTLGAGGLSGIYCPTGVAMRKVALTQVSPAVTFKAPVGIN
jgi:hypothetical protein